MRYILQILWKRVNLKLYQQLTTYCVKDWQTVSINEKLRTYATFKTDIRFESYLQSLLLFHEN